MDSLREMGLTMGEFAEKLMNEGLVEPISKAQPIHKQPQSLYEQRDISKIEVPDSFMKQVLGNKYTQNEKPKRIIKERIQESSKVQQPQLLNEEKIDELLDLLRDVKAMLSEMTTTGAIGVNLAGPQKSKKKKLTRSEIFKSALRGVKIK